MSNGETSVMDRVNISARRQQAAAATLILRAPLASIYHHVCQNAVFLPLYSINVGSCWIPGPHADSS